MPAAAPPPLPADLRAAAEAWRAVDPDPATRAEVQALLDAGDEAGLRDRFEAHLSFGTAGVRGRVGAGPNRMNRLVVRQVATGLARWLGAGRRVVVGRDARHGSAAFADEVATTLAAHGLHALVIDHPAPTPLLAFAVGHLAADAGVMVTASHNPRWDNGLKVYGGDGAQLAPPADAGLLAAVNRTTEHGPPPDPGSVAVVGPEVEQAYLAGAVASCPSGPREVRIVYTALHGVGRPLVEAALAAAGFAAAILVTSQAEPDPDFPTVPFPNPEEPGALDAALAVAREVGADLVLATDPDADRLGVAVPGPDGTWRVLTGDETGALLADHLLALGSGPDRLVVSTYVSSPLVGRLAAEAGVHHVETLTGFKWIVRPALAHPEWRFVLGYEEALGYAVTDLVRDKDGITAALAVAGLVARLAAQGQRVTDRLDDIARRHGLHASRTWSTRDDEPGGARRLRARLDDLRTAPPDEVAGVPLVAVVDHRLGSGHLPPTDALRWNLADGSRILLRPSGTEPKLKAYVHVVEPVSEDAGGPARARIEADRRLAARVAAVAALVGAGGGSEASPLGPTDVADPV